MFDRIREDLEAAFQRDPAARTRAEVVLTYPGLHALWCHRVAHWLWIHKRYLVARLVSHITRAVTGVEIHPGAAIGRRVFVDHGMGIVIGETSVIEDDVLLYQGVVLGGTSGEKVKRHPTLCTGVVVGAGAIVLGPVTVGENARIGAGSVVVKDVPADATVVGVPARLAGRRDDGDDTALDHGELPDPMVRVLSRVFDREAELEARILELEQKMARLHDLSSAEKVARSADEMNDAVLDKLRGVLDPEIGISIVNLGLIRGIQISGTEASVKMVLTSPTCPFAAQIIDQVRCAVLNVSGIDQVQVTLLDEPWSWAQFNNNGAQSSTRIHESECCFTDND